MIPVNRTFLVSPVASELGLDTRDILHAMNYKNDSIPEHLSELTAQILGSIDSHSHMQAGFIIKHIGGLDRENSAITVDSCEFQTGRTIINQLRGSEYGALFTASMGKPFDDWSQFYFRNGDPVTGYIIDTIGSEAVERVADILESRLLDVLADDSLKITNRYSPGYCDWSVSEQQKLFSLLPEHFCGINLTDSSLMIPVKSVSGIIGIGSDVTREEYPCRFCSRTDCHKRHLPEKEKIK